MTKTEYMQRTYRNKALLSTIGVVIALQIFAKQMFNYGSAKTVAYAEDLENDCETECDPKFND